MQNSRGNCQYEKFLLRNSDTVPQTDPCFPPPPFATELKQTTPSGAKAPPGAPLLFPSDYDVSFRV